MQEWVRFLSEDGMRLGLAVVLGGLIGLEREASDKPAGLRTNILICVGSTLMMILSIQVAQHYAVAAADPGRIAQGVITGIGFLGAGTILHSRGGVTGLTTAATTWAVAGIGLALGSGFYKLAIASTVLILAVLWAMGRLAHHWPNGKNARAVLRVVADEAAPTLDQVRDLIQAEGIPVLAWDYTRLRDGHLVLIECGAGRSDLPRLASRVAAVPGVRRARTV
ncbi:MAG TPA: MgtC/SapB family protein [Candidatus Polarisedimenticolia bacterium]|nr:MgtC/SapB family protein [Candidatus Polarisedimenticolia bacterium]